METQARYGVIGLFTLAVIAAGFLFVYWLHTTGGVGEQSRYRLRFEGSVAGLRPGSSVLFNGIKVGEVTSLGLVPGDTSRVEATVSVDRDTPVRADTRVAVEIQGLMGAPAVVLGGGTVPLAAGPGGTPVLDAGPNATETLTRSASSALKKLDMMLADNADPLKNAIAKFSVFADALARNSERLDNIASGLERMVGGGGAKKAPTIFDLTAPASFDPPPKAPSAALTVGDPTALVVFDTQKLLNSPKPGERSVYEDGQWSDTIPRMLQAKVLQSFENAGLIGSVGRPNDLARTELQLALDIRNFQVSEPDKAAVVEFAARLMSSDGAVTAAKIFRETAPVQAEGSEGAARAIDAAFGKAVTELVRWAGEPG